MNWQLRRSDLVFAYTGGGRVSAIEKGVEESRVISLNNTVDLASLAEAVKENAQRPSAAPWAGEIRDRNKTFAYIGGLDGAKRIDFLAEFLDALWLRDPEVRLLVGGTGAHQNLLNAARDRGQALLLGHVDDHDKAAMATLSSALLIPGRVGLVAAESFVLGLPIITTDNPYHAPEFEYLTPGVDAVVTYNSVPAYLDEVLALVNDPVRLDALKASAQLKSGWPSLDDMIGRFVNGCMSGIQSDRAEGA